MLFRLQYHYQRWLRGTLQSHRRLRVSLHTHCTARFTLHAVRLLESQAPFNEAVTRFYCACVILALDALQYESILLRTISLDTMVLTAEGLLQPSDLALGATAPPPSL